MPTSIVQNRLSDMRNARSGFETQWRRANSRKYDFLKRDQDFHPPLMWTLTNDIGQKIISAFDGSASFKPTATSKEKDAKFEIVTKIYNQENQKVNVQREREVAIQDSVDYRIGVLFEGYLKTGEVGTFDGLITERVDPRDFFIDDSAQVWYDPLNYRGAKDCIRRRWYSASNIKEVFKDPDYNQGVVNKFLRNQRTKEGEEGGTNMSREQQTSITEVDSLDANADGLICVWEYWSNNELIIEFDDLQGEPIYNGENPYGMLPFAPYSTFNTGESMYPPSINELLAPMTDRQAIMENMVYRGALLNQMPLIYAHQKAGIIPGQEIVPGVQVAELDDGDNINNFIQQIQLGGVSQSAQFWLANNDDAIIGVSKIDYKSIKNRPSVTATQTKEKIETESESIDNIVNTHMKGAETYRAILRVNNIMKFVLSDTQDVLINDHVQDDEGNLRSAEGSNVLIPITPEDYEDFEFQVIIKSENESIVEKAEKINQSERLLNTLQAFLAIPPEVMSSESKEGVKQAFDGLFEEIIKNISILDESKILKTGQGSMKIKEDIEEMRLGGDPMPEWNSEKQRQAMIATMGKALFKEMKGNKNVNVINAFQRYLLKLNDKTTKPVQETPQSPIAAPPQALPVGGPAPIAGPPDQGIPQAA